MIMPKRVLVLSPHTDDGELGAGGTMVKHLQNGGEVHYVAFSDAGKSLPAGSKPDALKMECMEATTMLGIPRKNIRILDYEVRDFLDARQQILEDLIKIRDKLHPDLVIAPSSSDVHQDHQVVQAEATRTFKTSASIWGYEHPWNNLNFNFDVLVSLTKKQVDLKIDALKFYRSQRNRPYFDPEYLYGLMKTHGVQGNFQYAEAFELVRAMIR